MNNLIKEFLLKAAEKTLIDLIEFDEKHQHCMPLHHIMVGVYSLILTLGNKIMWSMLK